MKVRILILLSLLVPSLYFAYAYHVASIKREKELVREYIRHKVSSKVTEEDDFPNELKFKDQEATVLYTLDSSLQDKLEALLMRYPNEGCAIVILDNDSGKILALGSIERESKKISYGLPFSSTHPSASLFKIVTMADLLNNKKMKPNSKVSYSGKSTTLYKYQLKNKINKWTRWVSLSRAFAQSNNVVFGKAAIQKSSANSIYERAYSFGFNKKLMEDFNLGTSKFSYPVSSYELAEVASGFTRETLISPVHAALLSSIVANNGILKNPYIIEKVLLGEEFIHYPKKRNKVANSEVVSRLSNMMKLTAVSGTARGLTRGRIGKKLKENLILGAKTGSITGGMPFGKREWLTLFAKRKNDDSKGISIGIMNIHKKKWYYKASFLAKKILNFYLETKDLASLKMNKNPDV